MKDILKTLILDFQESDLDTGTPRRLRVSPVPGKATVSIGVRRAGKSTYFFQLIRDLIDNGTPRENILYINFFDDRLHNLKREGLDLISEAYYSLFPRKKGTEMVHCFFDEIQSVDGWEPFVDRLLRTEKCDVYLTGSSAQLLSKDIATQMRGRALAWELFPFSFPEFLDASGIDAAAPYSTKRRLTIEHAFESYWIRGGFPEVSFVPDEIRLKIHQEYFHAILFRDLVERHDIPHPKAVVDLAHRLMDSVGSMYSINRLTGYLKSLGHRAPKSSVSDYISWFEDAFFLFSVRLFDASLSRRQTNPKKVYCVDHSMVRSVSSGILVNSGHLLENLVFTALRRRTSQIHYYKTKNGKEIDFITLDEDRNKSLVQVTESLADPDNRSREIQSLTEAMRELQLDSGTIVTRAETESIPLDSGAIEAIPAWRFLLEQDPSTNE